MILTSASEKDGERRRKSASPSAANGQSERKPRRKRAEGTELGSALRSAYQRTVDEAIPSDLLDLLGKLG